MLLPLHAIIIPVMPNVWSELTPDVIFNAVEKVIGCPLTNIYLRRNSYINRVFELEREDNRERLIAKFYRPGRWAPGMIGEEHQFLGELASAEIPVIPPLSFPHPSKGKTLFSANNLSFALFPKKGGRALDEFDQEGWTQLGRLIARIHLLGEKHQNTTRMSWRPATATKHHLEQIGATSFLLQDFQPAFKRTVTDFINKFEPTFSDQKNILLHGDCHKGNLINRPGEGIFIIDFDDLCFGPAVQDLWLLLPDTPERSENELGWLLKGYQTFRDFDEEELNLVPALRGMRIIHYIAWLATQSRDPDFDKYFPETGTARYWNESIRELQEIVAGL